MSETANTKGIDEGTILVVGSCGLDRILTTSKYPIPDSKVRSLDYNEVGGGNAANTASAMALLQNAKCWSRKVRVKLLSKVGDDIVGEQLVKELEGANVDTSSPLFRVGSPGSTSDVTTILVELQGHTRTCIHTPGSCGPLSIAEIESNDMDSIFKNVIHLHSDSRHTDAALRLVREAKRRGIPVSLDCEKDRSSESLDIILELTDIVFTNSNCLGAYLGRLGSELEANMNRKVLPEPSTKSTKHKMGDDSLNIYSKSLSPSAFFTRRYSQVGKQVIVTRGAVGALHYQPLSTAVEAYCGGDVNTIEVEFSRDTTQIHHRTVDNINGRKVACQTKYGVHQVGVVRDIDIVDTTGAGDAFIGGYLIALYGDESRTTQSIQLPLEFATWVSSMKLQGAGARSSLPSDMDVNTKLGESLDVVKTMVKQKIGPFNSNKNEMVPEQL